MPPLSIDSRALKGEEGHDNHNLSADEAMALDYALGILVEPDLCRVLIRIQHDIDFARLASRFADRLLADADEGSPIEASLIAPRSQTWNAILAQISKIGHS